MFQRDYILRLIEQISQVMARLLMLKTMEERQEALLQLEEFYGKLMLPPVRLLLRMPDEDLLALISADGRADLDKTAALAYLLKEEGRVHEGMEHYGESSVRFNKSLFLFLTAADQGADIAGLDCKAAITELRGLLRTYAIPEPTLRMLVQFYEREGRYAEAEDALFELLEEQADSLSGDSLTAEAGAAFYGRLRQLPDQSLEEGGLPREEVEQGERDMERLLTRLNR